VILCLCHGVSDHTVTATISAGAHTVDQVQRACDAGSDCGACRDLLEALVERARERHYAGATAVH
jgi:bacterioferritin-associated ferredoxin